MDRVAIRKNLTEVIEELTPFSRQNLAAAKSLTLHNKPVLADVFREAQNS
jgi:hypothetical protein